MRTFRHHSQPEYMKQAFFGPYRPESSQRVRDWLAAIAVGFCSALLLFTFLSN